jgi:hypothetical protein
MIVFLKSLIIYINYTHADSSMSVIIKGHFGKYKTIPAGYVMGLIFIIRLFVVEVRCYFAFSDSLEVEEPVLFVLLALV